MLRGYGVNGAYDVARPLPARKGQTAPARTLPARVGQAAPVKLLPYQPVQTPRKTIGFYHPNGPLFGGRSLPAMQKKRG